MAAGTGVRFGGLKQFAELVDGVRLIDRTVETTRNTAEWVGLVLPPDVDWDGVGVDAIGVGGSSRQESIAAGLALVPSRFDVVLVHSASHPLASVELARRAVGAVIRGADAAVPLLALADVLKRADDDRIVTVGREGFGLAQSPMAFSREIIDAAFASGDAATEESELVEKLGARVESVAGEVANIHVIDGDSLAVARAIAAGSVVV